MKSAVSLAIILMISACSPSSPKTVEVEVEKVKTFDKYHNTFGIDFKFTPIAEATPDEQEWAKSIALIKRAEGGYGTGFFISKSGLFLTNEHVIPVERCYENKCNGVEIIRHFAPNGKIESFRDFSVVAQNKLL